MSFQKAPTVNGLMELEEVKILEDRDELRTIRELFEPSIDVGRVNIHYIVSEYNEANETRLNGDTASYILEYMTEEEMKEMEQPLEEPMAE